MLKPCVSFGTAVLLWMALVPASGLAQPGSPSQPQQLPIQATTQIRDHRFELEVARSPEQQQMGLMFRASMPPNRGMAFPFDPPQPAAFWMFNTLIPLDIVFVYRGQVVHIAENVPGCPKLPCPSYGPPLTQLVDQVVEFNGGITQKVGLKVGDPLQVVPLPN